MLISVSELSRYWNVRPTGILHVGAHLAEENSDYEKFNWRPVTWVEAQPSLIRELISSLNLKHNRVIEAAVWDKNEVKLKLHVASNSMSSSLLELGSHADSYPEIKYVDEIEVFTKRLDAIIEDSTMPNFVNLDIQGTELQAIKSLGALLQKVSYIFVEVNRGDVYQNCTHVKELDSYLEGNEFRRVTTRWYLKQGWGDALYIRKDKIISQSPKQYISSKCISAIFYSKQFLRMLQIHKIFRIRSYISSPKAEG